LRTCSKIRFFLIATTLILSVNSCNRNNDVIPDVIVNFNLDLNDPEFVNLNAMGGSVTVNASTNNWGRYAAGYDGNGIIIYAGVNEFFAYDRTCPHDYVENGLSIRVNIDPQSSITAICPECKTAYALSANGTPASGVGRYPLKNYKATFDGRFVYVRNY
jgi:nitrite reductase/ring-hydroxylating ferredoxin subunit